MFHVPLEVEHSFPNWLGLLIHTLGVGEGHWVELVGVDEVVAETPHLRLVEQRRERRAGRLQEDTSSAHVVHLR